MTSSTTLNWRRLASSTLNGGGSFSSGSSGKNCCARSGTPASASISGHTFNESEAHCKSRITTYC